MRRDRSARATRGSWSGTSCRARSDRSSSGDTADRRDDHHRAGLSYLGFGVRPPTSAGQPIVAFARSCKPCDLRYRARLMIFLTVMSINFVGDGLRDALDPHSQR